MQFSLKPFTFTTLIRASTFKKIVRSNSSDMIVCRTWSATGTSISCSTRHRNVKHSLKRCTASSSDTAKTNTVNCSHCFFKVLLQKPLKNFERLNHIYKISKYVEINKCFPWYVKMCFLGDHWRNLTDNFSITNHLKQL